jgi:hypothetical protein
MMSLPVARLACQVFHMLGRDGGSVCSRRSCDETDVTDEGGCGVDTS